MREDILISRVYFVEEEDLPSYKVYRCMYPDGNEAEGGLIDKVQGEDAERKSDAMLYPQYDRSSPLTEPVSDKVIRMNTIGGANWKTVGQWIEWPVTVEKDGYYAIALRARQNLRSGAVSARRLYIDGQVPFKEAEKLSFSYSSDWQTAYLGDENGPYMFYLKAGTSTLRLEVVIGDLLQDIETIEDCALELNRIYREILMVVGATPDLNRDYEFEVEIPETLENIDRQREILLQAKESIMEKTGGTGETLAIIDDIILQLKIMSDNPRRIPKTYITFRDNVSALGSWLLAAWEQPLEIDYIMVANPDYQLPKGSASFFSSLAHEIKMFIYSFITDYSGSSESASEEDIKVWLLTNETVASGREQATIINRLISSGYRGGDVSLSVVAGASLLPSVLSGKSPDVVFNLFSADVMNYAAREALADLSVLEEDGTLESFSDSALLPLRYNGKLYGVPETQKFNVLFYRKDILDELGAEVPQSWEDVYALLPLLQRNNMFFGLPQGYASYPMFLYQEGGQFYTDDQKQCMLNSEAAVSAFVKQTRFFTDYGMPLDFDFANRFRSGECPVAISDYTSYNLLSVFAPEIKGLWSFTLVPGTTDEQGNIRSVTGSTVTSSAIMAGTDKMEASLRFIRWWASADTQGRYGREQEAVLGAAGRYAPANRDAIRMLPWNTEELKVVYGQLEQTVGIPEVPGGYYMSRYVDFAFRKAVIAKEDPREALLSYVEDINDEILYKRQEFHLDG